MNYFTKIMLNIFCFISFAMVLKYNSQLTDIKTFLPEFIGISIILISLTLISRNEK